jgi:CheY-like chemotaxis protein
MASRHEPLVLIADDHRDTCEMYAFYLGAVGYRVEMAADGHEATAMARQLHPDVIVMDLNMPRVDGWSALKVLRDDPSMTTIPVIIITGHDFKTFLKPAALAAGAVSYLIKPCLPERLADEISNRLRTPRSAMPPASGE